jgi:hypothetical protein
MVEEKRNSLTQETRASSIEWWSWVALWKQAKRNQIILLCLQIRHLRKFQSSIFQVESRSWSTLWCHHPYITLCCIIRMEDLSVTSRLVITWKSSFFWSNLWLSHFSTLVNVPQRSLRSCQMKWTVQSLTSALFAILSSRSRQRYRKLSYIWIIFLKKLTLRVCLKKPKLLTWAPFLKVEWQEKEFVPKKERKRTVTEWF